MTWYVYTLRQPSTQQTFYVGITQWLWQRLAHHKSDCASSAWSRIRSMREAGEQPLMVIQHEFDRKYPALLLENEILRSTAGLVNQGKPKQQIIDMGY